MEVKRMIFIIFWISSIISCSLAREVERKEGSRSEKGVLRQGDMNV